VIERPLEHVSRRDISQAALLSDPTEDSATALGGGIRSSASTIASGGAFASENSRVTRIGVGCMPPRRYSQ
jgi:hypothetical protein